MHIRIREKKMVDPSRSFHFCLVQVLVGLGLVTVRLPSVCGGELGPERASPA